MSETPHRPTVPSKPLVSKEWWTKTRLIAGAGIAATLIGVLGIVVPLVATAGDRATSGDSISVDSQQASTDGEGLVAGGLAPVEAGLTNAAGSASTAGRLITSAQYAVPIDAPWDELFAVSDVCTNEIFDWLDAHGKPILPYELTSTITNTATTGATALVSDIRAQGVLTAPPTDTVNVGATACIGGMDEGVFATMALGVDPVAVFDDCYAVDAQFSCAGSETEVPVPGDPVVFDVGPGETRDLHLTWTQTMNFVGRFVATVSVDGVESTIDLSPEGKDLDIPTVTRPDVRLYFGSDGTWCQSTPDQRTDGCSVDAWRAILANG